MYMTKFSIFYETKSIDIVLYIKRNFK